MTIKLYDKVLEYAALTGVENVLIYTAESERLVCTARGTPALCWELSLPVKRRLTPIEMR